MSNNILFLLIEMSSFHSDVLNVSCAAGDIPAVSLQNVFTSSPGLNANPVSPTKKWLALAAASCYGVRVVFCRVVFANLMCNPPFDDGFHLHGKLARVRKFLDRRVMTARLRPESSIIPVDGLTPPGLTGAWDHGIEIVTISRLSFKPREAGLSASVYMHY